MEQKLSNELYEPPEVALCLVQVELGYDASSDSGGTTTPPYSGGGGSTTTTTDVGGGSSALGWDDDQGFW